MYVDFFEAISTCASLDHYTLANETDMEPELNCQQLNSLQLWLVLNTYKHKLRGSLCNAKFTFFDAYGTSLTLSKNIKLNNVSLREVMPSYSLPTKKIHENIKFP